MMRNDFWGKSACGTAPDCGAIFMSNRRTMDECFDRQLFGLPHAFSEFVKLVEAGMVLFLFEYEQRKLYGVFRAVSAGRMNIVSSAYHSSGRTFPAQVQFSVIWNCHPLSEHDFHDAIKENYFAARKFNFGLSKHQVQRLLYLFHSRMIRVQKILRNEKDTKTYPLVKSVEENPVGEPMKLSEHIDDYSSCCPAAPSVLGDYIPLSETDLAFSEAPCDEEEEEDLCMDEAACIYPRSFAAREKTSSVFDAAAAADIKDACDESSPRGVKGGMYSDISEVKSNVFSRLSVESNTRSIIISSSRSSVFSRLSVAPPPVERKDDVFWLDELASRAAERKNLKRGWQAAAGIKHRYGGDVKKWNTWIRDTSGAQKRARLVSVIVKTNVERGEGSPKSDKTAGGDDELLGFSVKDTVSAAVAISGEGNGEDDQWKGLTNSDSVSPGKEEDWCHKQLFVEQGEPKTFEDTFL